MKRSVQYLLTLGLFIFISTARADAVSNDIVISHVQAGAASSQAASAMQEFVIVYNNSDHDVDVTNWCLSNVSKPLVSFACITAGTANQKLYLAVHTYLVVASDHFSMQHNNYPADVIFPTTNNSSGSIAAGVDTITLKNGQGSIVDTVSWSTSAFSPTGGFVLQRHIAADLVTMIDTDNTSNDFSKMQGIILPASGIYEVVIDACSNIADIQDTVPVGFLKDVDGSCYQDSCANLDGLQKTMPEEYVRTNINDCTFDYVRLQITELLANAAGGDDGHEFIELYNPTDRVAFLINYALRIGDKTYTFPSGLKMNPGQYMAFYNNEIAFTLVNTTSNAALLSDDGALISQSDTYDTPRDDMSWALIGDVWQYTNQLTFASANIASIIDVEDEEVESAVDLPPCATNQYRHPETHRCRLLVALAPAVAACKDGQYRSEETNRCRTIALAGGTLTPCKDGQYRSEETNHCRNLATTASTLVPCKDNQYRSEETNRCRIIAATSVPAAAFAIEPIADSGKTFVGWYVLGGVGIVALSYGAWEWRREVMLIVRRCASFFTRQ